MQITFDKDNHGFMLDGVKVPSVTKVLMATGISPDYSGLDPKYAEYGRQIHLNMERKLKGEEYEDGFEIDNLAAWLGGIEGMSGTESEMRLGSSLGYCGIADLVVKLGDGTAVIADFKTGRAAKEAVRWQLSMYAEAYEEMTGAKVIAMWALEKIADPLQFRAFKVNRVCRDNIATLMDEYRNGERHGGGKELLPANEMRELVAALDALETMEEERKALDAKMAGFRSSMLAAMKAADIKVFEGMGWRFTAKAESVQERVDSAKLKSEHPDIWRECIKEVKVCESLITKRKQEE